MKSALIKLRDSAVAFSEAECSVARYVTDHPEEVVEMSVQQLATRIFSSPATVIRMCRRSGFEGYKELRRDIRMELELRRQRKEDTHHAIDQYKDLEEIVRTVTDRSICALEASSALIQIDTLQKCVDLMTTCRRILLFGMGASLCVAKDAYLKFLRIDKMCVINDDFHSQLLQARNAGKNDLGIVLSYSGETVEVIECLRVLHDKGVPSIAITRNAPSTVAQLATHILYVSANESTFRDGAMSSRISQSNAIDILYTAFANSAFEHWVDQIDKTHIDKPHLQRPDLHHTLPTEK